MFQNFKTDIIYYNTPADFELEFNLCGCCRMRLFNDKCSDKKNLLLSLSRAVSRSRVIIITAPIFTEDNITSTIATAIGSSVETINNAEYNINSNVAIEVIKGAVPLVTPEGIYGGCIIESGPQSLILLTDNKSVRKNIMKNLIHPYVEEIAYSRNEEDETTKEETPAEEIPENEQETPCEETVEAEAEETAENEETEESENENLPENTEADLFIDISSESDEKAYYESEDGFYTEIDSKKKKDEDDEDDGYYCDDEYYTDHPTPSSSPFNVWLLVISIIILLSLAVLCYCIFYVPTKAGVSPSAYLKDIFNTMFK